MPRLLIIAEHDQGQLKLATLAAAGCAQDLCATRPRKQGAPGPNSVAPPPAAGLFDLLLLGHHVGAVAESLRHLGADTVLVADHPALENPLADRYAYLIAEVARQRGATLIAAAASTFSKDILPRVAALLDAGMISDVIDVRPLDSDYVFKRVLFAGNVLGTVQLEGCPKVLTLRAAAFPAADTSETASPIVPVPVEAASLPHLTEFVSREQKIGGRPDATEARIVVSGGRAIKTAEDFERLVGRLADTLGGAVGSSRALVDSGITPNSLQVGQTGKVVAPDLYIALGISGAIQHMAGMKDTKVVVAINKDPDAPIFELADYGLVADVYEAAPQLVERLKP